MKNTRLRQACVLIDQAIDARDRQIVAMHEQGMTLREIADASGGHLSHGGVAGIIKRRTSQGSRTAPQTQRPPVQAGKQRTDGRRAQGV